MIIAMANLKMPETRQTRRKQNFFAITFSRSTS